MINLFFDVDDTLYDQLLPFTNAFDELFKTKYHITRDEIYKRSRYYSDIVFDDVEAGKMKKEDMYVYRITRAFKDYGIRLEYNKALEFQKLYEKYQMKMELLPEMKMVLDWSQSHAGVTGIITNGPSAHQKDKIRQLGLEKWIQKSCIFISEEIKLAKPDMRLFRLIQEKLNLIPTDTYFIGDSYHNDVIGAKKAGWKAIWVNKRNHKLPESGNIVPDYTVKENGELWNIIQDLAGNCGR